MTDGVDYEIKPGDCITSLAYERGFRPETIWDTPENAVVKKLREDPGVLLPGDRIFLPAKRLHQEAQSTGQRHRFRRLGSAAQLRIEFLVGDTPMANQPYVLTIDGRQIRGCTDDSGLLEEPIPANAKGGTLQLGEGEQQHEFELALGHLDPVSAPSGQRARLNHLGFDCGWSDSGSDESRAEALALFRHTHRPDDADDADDADDDEAVTIDELGRVHGA